MKKKWSSSLVCSLIVAFVTLWPGWLKASEGVSTIPSQLTMYTSRVLPLLLNFDGSPQSTIHLSFPPIEGSNLVFSYFVGVRMVPGEWGNYPALDNADFYFDVQTSVSNDTIKADTDRGGLTITEVTPVKLQSGTDLYFLVTGPWGQEDCQLWRVDLDLGGITGAITNITIWSQLFQDLRPSGLFVPVFASLTNTLVHTSIEYDWPKQIVPISETPMVSLLPRRSPSVRTSISSTNSLVVSSRDAWGYILQSSTDLLTWTEEFITPHIVDDRKEWVIPTTEEYKFFRLSLKRRGDRPPR